MLKGKRTWTGLLILLLGALGWGDLISEEEVSGLINSFTELVGLVIAVYGNYSSHVELKKLGGYE